MFYEIVLEPSHLFPSPAGYCSIVYALALVRDHKVLADSDDFAQSSAHRTRSEGAVEAEHIFVRLAEGYPVCLESVDKLLLRFFLRIVEYYSYST